MLNQPQKYSHVNEGFPQIVRDFFQKKNILKKSTNPLVQEGQWDQIVEVDFEHLHGWRLCSLSGQPAPVFDCTHSKPKKDSSLVHTYFFYIYFNLCQLPPAFLCLSFAILSLITIIFCICKFYKNRLITQFWFWKCSLANTFISSGKKDSIKLKILKEAGGESTSSKKNIVF